MIVLVTWGRFEEREGREGWSEGAADVTDVLRVCLRPFGMEEAYMGGLVEQGWEERGVDGIKETDAPRRWWRGRAERVLVHARLGVGTAVDVFCRKPQDKSHVQSSHSL